MASAQVPQLSNEKPAPEDAVAGRLSAFKKNINSARRRMARAICDLLEAAAESPNPEWSSREFQNWLRIECGLSRSDIVAARSYRDNLTDDQRLLLRTKRLPPESLKALASSNAETRVEILRRIETSGTIDHREISFIKKTLKHVSMTPEQRLLEARSRHFASASRRTGGNLSQTLVHHASTLLDAIIAFRNEFHSVSIFSPEDDPFECDEYCRAYNSQQEKIRVLADLTILHFRALFGDDFRPVVEWDAIPSEADDELRACMAQEALRLLSRGEFGIRHGFDLVGEGDMRSNELQDAIAYLAGRNLGEAAETASEAQPSKKLTVLELCAGAGGQAIGLMGAGFKALGLVDNNRDALDTLRSNWPAWNVMPLNLKSPKADSKLSRFAGKVDVIATGAPCQPFSRRGVKNGEKDDRQLFDRVKHFIATIRPRAAFFENVVGFLDDKHAVFRARLIKEFDSIGYDVTIFKMKATDFGLPQGRERVVMVCMRKDVKGRFKEPVLKRRITADLSLAIGDIARSRIEEVVSRKFSDEARRLQAIEKWMANWVKMASVAATPTVLGLWTRNNIAESFERWKISGLDMRPIYNRSNDHGQFVSTNAPIPVTVPILKRLQGIPDRWKITGNLRSQTLQIANAFPPIMAKAVGLSIRSALTGEVFDLNTELLRPMIEEDLIGKSVPEYRPKPRRGRPLKGATRGKPDLNWWHFPSRSATGRNEEVMRKKREIIYWYTGSEKMPSLRWRPPDLPRWPGGYWYSRVREKLEHDADNADGP